MFDFDTRLSNISWAEMLCSSSVDIQIGKLCHILIDWFDFALFLILSFDRFDHEGLI